MLQEIENPPGLTGAARWGAPERRTATDILRRKALPLLVFYLSLTGSLDAVRYMTGPYRLAHLAEDAARLTIGSPPDAGITAIEKRIADHCARSRGNDWRPGVRVSGSARQPRLMIEGHLTPLNPLLKLILGSWSFRRDLELTRP